MLAGTPSARKEFDLPWIDRFALNMRSQPSEYRAEGRDIASLALARGKTQRTKGQQNRSTQEVRNMVGLAPF
jgi:hypothetical protein